MKAVLKTILTVWLAGMVFFVSAQDVIITKDSKKIDAKVTEVNVDNIRYRDFNNPEGPVYTILKNEIVSILYQNGTVETYTTSKTSPPKPDYQSYSSVNRTTDCVNNSVLVNVWAEGDVIHYHDRRAGNRDIKEILQKTYYPSYRKFVSGDRAVHAGVVLLITGSVLAIGGIVLIENSGYYDEGGSGQDEDMLIAGVTMCILGGAEIITSIPLMAAGNAKRKRAKREFIINCMSLQPEEKTEKRLEAPHLDFTVKNNELGLAWTF